MHKIKQGNAAGFTLVELIVVIVILAILATIAFLSFSSQSSSARDSTRLSDLANISKGLSIQQTIASVFPLPDGAVNINNGTELVGYQGEVGKTVKSILKVSNDGFVDPIDKSNYTYVTNKNKNKYKLGAFLENKGNITLDIKDSPFAYKINAAEYTDRYFFTVGDSIPVIIYQSGSISMPVQDMSKQEGTAVTASGVNLKIAASEPSFLYVSNNGSEAAPLIANLAMEYNGVAGEQAKSFFLSANDGITGMELWSTDGTDVGTKLIKDINPGIGNSNPINFTEINGKTFFNANNGVTDQLWVTDGTESGTIKIKDSYSYIASIKGIQGKLIFSNNGELWSTDGTESGTIKIADCDGGIGNSYEIDGKNFIILQHLGANNLYITDGTLAGTIKLSPDGKSAYLGLRLINGKIIFISSDNGSINQVWATDGTLGGTIMLKDGNNHFTNGTNIDEISLGLFMNTSGSNQDLWATDGTLAGTNILKTGQFQADFLTMNGKTYLSEYASGSNYVWVTDGTLAGTIRLIGPVGILNGGGIVLGGKMYYNIVNGGNNQVWATDGTLAGTAMLSDGPEYVSLNKEHNANSNKTFFVRYSAASNKLYLTDGTVAGTSLVKTSENNWPLIEGTLGNKKIFLVTDGGVDSVWSIDITDSSSQKIYDISTGLGGMFILNGRFVFFDGARLIQTDGTVAGTKEIEANAQLLSVQDNVLFYSKNGNELWSTDGTDSGKKMLKVGVTNVGYYMFKNINGSYYISMNDGEHGNELWISDLTESGTRMIMDINVGIGNFKIDED